MRRNFGRKLFISSMIASTLICTPVMAADTKEWTIGYEENTNGPVEGEQGTNGWYFLYSEETNTKGAMDTEKLQECVWANSGSCWMYYGYREMWMPEKYAAEDYDCDEEGNWWLMDGNGIMNAGADNYRSVVAWEAPQSGTYSVELEYTAGTDSYEWEGITYYQEDADGLILSINSETDVLEKVQCDAVTKKNNELSTGTLSTEIELKKGEKIYISADPGEKSGGDSATIKMSIKQTKTASIFEGNTNLFMIIIVAAGILIGIISVLIRKKREAL